MSDYKQVHNPSCQTSSGYVHENLFYDVDMRPLAIKAFTRKGFPLFADPQAPFVFYGIWYHDED